MVKTSVSSAGLPVVVIQVVGRFDFQCHREFRDAYYQHTGKECRYVVDMSRTDYMDSSGLGMLLLLREHAGGDKADIVISQPNPTITKVLTIANFHKMFKIEQKAA
jgi:anti-anti-sigma factor